MDISTMFRISGSAMGAQKKRLEAVAENLAGANVTRGENGQPYRRKDVTFSTFAEHLDQATGKPEAQLVRAQVQTDDRPFKKVYQPGHPHADATGYVSMPNVNVMEEMVNMVSATRSYEANVKAIGATKAMAEKALEIGR